jgi:hypothetical protein
MDERAVYRDRDSLEPNAQVNAPCFEAKNALGPDVVAAIAIPLWLPSKEAGGRYRIGGNEEMGDYAELQGPVLAGAIKAVELVQQLSLPGIGTG